MLVCKASSLHASFGALQSRCRAQTLCNPPGSWHPGSQKTEQSLSGGQGHCCTKSHHSGWHACLAGKSIIQYVKPQGHKPPELPRLQETALGPEARVIPPRSGHCAAALPAAHEQDVIIFGGCALALTALQDSMAGNHDECAGTQRRAATGKPAMTHGPTGAGQEPGLSCSMPQDPHPGCARQVCLLLMRGLPDILMHYAEV